MEPGGGTAEGVASAQDYFTPVEKAAGTLSCGLSAARGTAAARVPRAPIRLHAAGAAYIWTHSSRARR